MVVAVRGVCRDVLSWEITADSGAQTRYLQGPVEPVDSDLCAIVVAGPR